jgi:hypothetical protein
MQGKRKCTHQIRAVHRYGQSRLLPLPFSEPRLGCIGRPIKLVFSVCIAVATEIRCKSSCVLHFFWLKIICWEGRSRQKWEQQNLGEIERQQKYLCEQKKIFFFMNSGRKVGKLGIYFPPQNFKLLETIFTYFPTVFGYVYFLLLSMLIDFQKSLNGNLCLYMYD